jgi:hypothetical protein
MPLQLRGHRQINLRSADGRQALLCTLAHNPLSRTTPPSRRDAISSGLKIVAGASAIAIGNLNAIQTFISTNFSDTTANQIHYLMVILVGCLLFVGYLGIIQLLWDLLDDLLPRPTAWGPSLWRTVVPGAMALMLLGFSYRYFPRRPHFQAIAESCEEAWAHRLFSSEGPDGGFRDHPDKEVSQVWTTGQALAAVLTQQLSADSYTHDIVPAIAFIDSERIAAVSLRSDQEQRLADVLAASGSLDEVQRKLQKLSTVSFPNVPMAEEALGHIAGNP